MEDVVACWYQSISSQLPSTTWDTFCQLLHDRFDRDQHEILLRLMFNICMQSSVSTYVTDFTKLIDQLKAYSPNSNPLFYTTRIVDGLHADIKATVILHYPPNLDTACHLTL